MSAALAVATIAGPMIEAACRKVVVEPKADPPSKIKEVVKILARCEQPEMPVTHNFSPGKYVRTIFMPALPGGGTYVVGHVHKARHWNYVMSGSATVTIGDETREIVAPCVFESMAGAQKLLTVTEDMWWTTVHENPDNFTDIPAIEALVFDLPQEIKDSGLELDQFRMNRNLTLEEKT